jgi:hypothetical protein
MKIRILLMIGLMLVGSYASASAVLVQNGISWTSSMTGVGTQTGSITLNANTSGASGALAGGGYLAGIGIKDLGGNFKITSVSLTDWGFNNDELSASGSACDSGTGSSSKRGCAFAENLGARLSSAAGNLAIVLGVELQSGVLLDTFHLKVRWEDASGKKIGSLISDDLTAVPLPAAAWLFGSALMGLTVVARRRDKKAPLVA